MFTSSLLRESIETYPLKVIDREFFIENHILKILIMVLTIVLSLSPTPNALRVDILVDSIAEMSGTIPIVNYGGSVFVLFPSLLGGLNIIGMLKN